MQNHESEHISPPGTGMEVMAVIGVSTLGGAWGYSDLPLVGVALGSARPHFSVDKLGG